MRRFNVQLQTLIFQNNISNVRKHYEHVYENKEKNIKTKKKTLKASYQST